MSATNQKQNQPQPQQMVFPYPKKDGTYNASPPAGYPNLTKDALPQSRPVPIETKSKGEGFWTGCLAALCCCCALEAFF